MDSRTSEAANSDISLVIDWARANVRYIGGKKTKSVNASGRVPTQQRVGKNMTLMHEQNFAFPLGKGLITSGYNSRAYFTAYEEYNEAQKCYIF